MQLNSHDSTLVVVAPGGLISGDRVAVHPRALGAAPSGLLSAFPGEAVERSRPVRLLSSEHVPEGVLAVGEELAAALDLFPAERVPWTLRTDDISHLRAEGLTLEVTVDQRLDELVAQLNRSEDLAGRLLWVPGGRVGQALSLEVNGKPFRVRELSPASAGRSAVVEVTPETRLKVFAPGYKSGIDIVILADCSWSMTNRDLTRQSEPVPEGGGWSVFRQPASHSSAGLARIEALQQSLRQLLETRLRVSGRVSRVALASFTTRTDFHFPHSGGMAEIDENSPPEVIQQFRDSVRLLRAEQNSGTDIGQAIFIAAQHLHRYGRPGNDRLIVLISDGANWRPKGEKDVGDVVQAMQEPVSLMEHLHREMKIHLHAIGISTREIFMRYYRQCSDSDEPPHPSAVPNHELLERLVEVGGGDPTEIGDTGVLQRYLTALGAGVTRHVHPPRPAPIPPLQPHEIEALARARRPTGAGRELSELTREIEELFRDCNEHTESVVSRRMFDPSPSVILETFRRSMVTEVRARREFAAFISDLYLCFCESVDKRMKTRKVDGEPDPIPAVTDILHGERMNVINILRNSHAHDKRRDLREDAATPGGSRRDAKRENAQLVEVLRRLVDAPHVESGDAARWSRLQTAVLGELRDVLTQVREEFRRAGRPGPAEAPAAPPDSEFVWKW